MIEVRQIKAARALLFWHQADLAKRSGLSIVTIRRLESVGIGPLGGEPETYERIVSALQRAGIEFSNGGVIGVTLRQKRK